MDNNNNINNNNSRPEFVIPCFAYIENHFSDGYLTPDGTFYPSNDHSPLCKQLVYQLYFDKYKKFAGVNFFDKPRYTLQEEFYLLKHEKWVKIQTIRMSVDGSEPDRKGIYYYHALSDKQKAFLNIK